MQTLRRIGIDDAALLAGVSRSTFRKHIYNQEQSALLTGFPAPCARGGRVLWIEQDVLDWLAAQRTYKPAQAAPAAQPQQQKRPRGRPRKLAVAGGEGGAA